MRLRQVIRTVQDAQRLVRETDKLMRELQRLTTQPQPQDKRKGGHGPDCRHCQLVEAYRLERDAQLRAREGVFGQDEDQPDPVTFREWLKANGTERRLTDEQWATEWAEA